MRIFHYRHYRLNPLDDYKSTESQPLEASQTPLIIDSKDTKKSDYIL